MATPMMQARGKLANLPKDLEPGRIYIATDKRQMIVGMPYGKPLVFKESLFRRIKNYLRQLVGSGSSS